MRRLFRIINKDLIQLREYGASHREWVIEKNLEVALCDCGYRRSNSIVQTGRLKAELSIRS
jgi:hypothetical protein